MLVPGMAVANGEPDLFIFSDMIEFVSKNGDTTPFNEAEVGDVVEVKARIGNAVQAETAINVQGIVYIELGFDQIQLGTFSIPSIPGGAFADVVLMENVTLPVPPVPLPGGSFEWTVTPPSPWLDVFTFEIQSGDTTPANNAASKALQVGQSKVPLLTPPWTLLLIGALLLLSLSAGYRAKTR